eukprot:CAMPEP_0184495726 /NCGR_PEP_ID=MMETSP0113_2-20130426/32138_1 /TAXON_ID=91329 /ORGANISM="Norrisiella sphaerica, Strain BC52" /LENGTH=533 /DNA_ID=CAMNT_0026882039 /DNA_START=282 /DNA_END=1883 /DNA_ORIENTATION=+
MPLGAQFGNAHGSNVVFPATKDELGDSANIYDLGIAFAILKYIANTLLPIICGGLVDLQGTPLGCLLFLLLALAGQVLAVLAHKAGSGLGVFLAESLTEGSALGIAVANAAILSQYFQKSELGLSLGSIGAVSVIYTWIMKHQGDDNTEQELSRWWGVAAGAASALAGLVFVLTDTVHRKNMSASAMEEEFLEDERMELMVAPPPPTAEEARKMYDRRRKNMPRGCCAVPGSVLMIAFSQLLFSTSHQALHELKKLEMTDKIGVSSISVMAIGVVTGPVTGVVLDRLGKRMHFMMVLGWLLAFAQFLFAFAPVPQALPLVLLTLINAAAPIILRSTVPYLVPRKEWGVSFGIYQGFMTTGVYGSHAAAFAFKEFWVSVAFIVCGILGFFVSMGLMCCGEMSERLSLPTSLAYITKVRGPLQDVQEELEKHGNSCASWCASTFTEICPICESCACKPSTCMDWLGLRLWGGGEEDEEEADRKSPFERRGERTEFKPAYGDVSKDGDGKIGYNADYGTNTLEERSIVTSTTYGSM